MRLLPIPVLTAIAASCSAVPPTSSTPLKGCEASGSVTSELSTASVWPSAVAPPSATAAHNCEVPGPRRAVPSAQTFALSNVVVSPHNHDSELVVSYRVDNASNRRQRGRLCVEILDVDGYILEEGTYGEFGLKPGDWDEVEEKGTIDSRSSGVWATAKLLRLSVIPMNESCAVGNSAEKDTLSPTLLLDVQGRPLAPQAILPKVKPRNVQASGSARLDTPRFSAAPDGVRFAVKVTNTSSGRIAGSVCVRLYGPDTCICKHTDSADSTGYNLAPGASIDLDGLLTWNHGDSWNKAQTLRIYAAPFGCVDTPEEASSQVLSLRRPAFRVSATP